MRPDHWPLVQVMASRKAVNSRPMLNCYLPAPVPAKQQPRLVKRSKSSYCIDANQGSYAEYQPKSC